jgi:hypothetical protein
MSCLQEPSLARDEVISTCLSSQILQGSLHINLRGTCTSHVATPHQGACLLSALQCLANPASNPDTDLQHQVTGHIQSLLSSTLSSSAPDSVRSHPLLGRLCCACAATCEKAPAARSLARLCMDSGAAAKYAADMTLGLSASLAVLSELVLQVGGGGVSTGCCVRTWLLVV